MLSMKFPHLFLRPEIIITFLWGWEWSGGQVRHRSPRNSGHYKFVLFSVYKVIILEQILHFVMDIRKLCLYLNNFIY